MLKRPSQRRRSHGTQEADLPLVPIMDAFVTLIAFLLLVTSMLAVTLIDTPVPVVSSVPDDPKKNDKPLALTLQINQDGLKLSSAFRRIPEAAFPKVDKGYDLEKLHEALVAIRKQFPLEKSIVFMPVGDIKYNDIVGLMDAVRLYVKTDETLFITGDDGVSKPDPFLFQGVMFGNVISGNGG
ncbi:MAG: biopolymer transporter ExbD [Proteobacteria bacterium]|nr:MAG: biopolymer transporter ExbD [Pseudomonadota bacterium]